MTDATHTRESDEVLINRLRFYGSEEQENLVPYFAQSVMRTAADELERRISTPIPLTPSDEMIAAASDAYWGTSGRHDYKEYRDMGRALQAALNLMGGKK